MPRRRKQNQTVKPGFRLPRRHLDTDEIPTNTSSNGHNSQSTVGVHIRMDGVPDILKYTYDWILQPDPQAARMAQQPRKSLGVPTAFGTSNGRSVV
jgi:hypothetical protein